MLRKLFIGLLILSALSARGAGNEITDIFEPQDGPSPESFLNLSGEKWLADAGMPLGIGNAAVSLEEFIRVKSLEQHIFSNIGDNTSIGCGEGCIYITRPVVFSHDDNRVSKGSDISPPAV